MTSLLKIQMARCLQNELHGECSWTRCRGSKPEQLTVRLGKRVQATYSNGFWLQSQYMGYIKKIKVRRCHWQYQTSALCTDVHIFDSEVNQKVKKNQWILFFIGQIYSQFFENCVQFSVNIMTVHYHFLMLNWLSWVFFFLNLLHCIHCYGENRALFYCH